MEGFNDFQEIAGHTFRLGGMENAVLLICVLICFYSHAYQKIRTFWAFDGSQPIFCWWFSRRIPQNSFQTCNLKKTAIDDIIPDFAQPNQPKPTQSSRRIWWSYVAFDQIVWYLRFWNLWPASWVRSLWASAETISQRRLGVWNHLKFAWELFDLFVFVPFFLGGGYDGINGTIWWWWSFHQIYWTAFPPNHLDIKIFGAAFLQNHFNIKILKY